jgi:hypothetical protein
MKNRGAPPYRRRQDFEPPAPKPFDFVPLSSQVKREKQVPGHEKFVLADQVFSGQLRYQLVAHSHLFVSSGQYALGEDVGFEAGQVIRSCYRVTVGGQSIPAIPGASLKGMARAIVEAVTASCISITRVDRRSLPNPEAARLCRPEALCPACALFGTMSRLARLSFGDARLAQGNTMLYRLPPLYRPRAEQSPRTYKDSQRQFKGRKFYFHGQKVEHTQGARVEVIPETSMLAGSLDFESLKAEELGLLFFALGLDGSFRPMLGGGKPVCLGTLEFQPTTLELVTANDFVTYDAVGRTLEGDELSAFVQQRIEGAMQSGLIVARQQDALRKILDPDNTRPAPTGLY